MNCRPERRHTLFRFLCLAHSPLRHSPNRANRRKKERGREETREGKRKKKHLKTRKKEHKHRQEKGGEFHPPTPKPSPVLLSVTVLIHTETRHKHRQTRTTDMNACRRWMPCMRRKSPHEARGTSQEQEKVNEAMKSTAAVHPLNKQDGKCMHRRET
mmetsp:Transcript_10388/g.20139  ORF Transcript_10388/g.20139 Transcript_10388/m.20139 type:complete len:157 (-) Transcript_10388:537-1007(-)